MFKFMKKNRPSGRDWESELKRARKVMEQGIETAADIFADDVALAYKMECGTKEELKARAMEAAAKAVDKALEYDDYTLDLRLKAKEYAGLLSGLDALASGMISMTDAVAESLDEMTNAMIPRLLEELINERHR